MRRQSTLPQHLIVKKIFNNIRDLNNIMQSFYVFNKKNIVRIAQKVIPYNGTKYEQNFKSWSLGFELRIKINQHTFKIVLRGVFL